MKYLPSNIVARCQAAGIQYHSDGDERFRFTAPEGKVFPMTGQQKWRINTYGLAHVVLDYNLYVIDKGE